MQPNSENIGILEIKVFFLYKPKYNSSLIAAIYTTGSAINDYRIATGHISKEKQETSVLFIPSNQKTVHLQIYAFANTQKGKGY